MSSHASQNSNDQEIDLGLVSKKISQGFDAIATSLFRSILFVKRNIILILILFMAGAAAGFYLDSTTKVYDHKIIVKPNFKSNEYLYSKVELLQAKIKEKDTVFLKKIGVQDTKKLLKITIEPVIDIFKFVENRKENLDLVKLMAENTSIDKVIEDRTTSINYPFHSISFTTSRATTKEKTVTPILNYLNNSDYFLKVQEVEINNTHRKYQSNEQIIAQIDGLLSEFTAPAAGNSAKSDKLVYINENSQLNDIIKTKDDLVTEQGWLRLQKVDFERIIKELSTTLNIKNTKSVTGKMKLILPFVFVFIFILVVSMVKFYKRQSEKLANA